MTDTIFADVSAPAVPPVVPAPVDPLLASITDETGKPKYASVEAALKALANAQVHIKTIETENSQLREATTKAKTLEDILKAIKPAEAAPVVETPAPTKPVEVDIAGLVAQTVLGLEVQKTEQANIQSVVERAKQAYGENANTSFYTKAAELGFDKAGINELAKKNPNAVFKLLGLEDKAPANVPKGSIRSDAFLEKAPDNTKRSGMAHGDTAHLVDAWRNAVAKTNSKLGINT